MMHTRKSDCSEATDDARIELSRVGVSYNGQPALDDITVTIEHGAQVAVVGPNGAGKSTLFKALVGLLPLRQGQILIHGRPLGSHNNCVAYIPQREEIDWRFPVTVNDVVMMSRYGRLGWLRRPGARDMKAIAAALDQLGIANLADISIGELSGGQQQRVFLARALAQEPHILLMDEPFTGVDVSTQETILDVLTQLRQRSVTVLVATHDLNMAATRFEKTLLLNHRLIAYGHSEEVFTSETIRQAFGAQVFEVGANLVIDQCCGGHNQQAIQPLDIKTRT
ncbi:MAG: metal ABC transporter ATP-binding protein [Chloroflexi bacterium]|nr:metal ABC transporter ATP-binding protein [Chloroflexota bacterium]